MKNSIYILSIISTFNFSCKKIFKNPETSPVIVEVKIENVCEVKDLDTAYVDDLTEYEKKK